MINPARIRPLLLLALTLVAMTILASGLSGLQFRPGQPLPLGRPGDTSAAGVTGGPAAGWPGLLVVGWPVLLLLAFVGLVLLWIITFILRPKSRKYLLSRMLAYFILLLLISGLIFALRQPAGIENLETTNPLFSSPVPAGQPTGADRPAPPPYIVTPPRWLIIAVSVAVSALMVGAGRFLWIQRLKPQPAPAALLAQQAQEAVQAIEAGQNLTNTVMACYLKMTQILQEQQGVSRQAAMTPREFEAHLSQMGLDNRHIHRLTRLFEAVRYGNAPSGQQQEQEALACLQAIAAACGALP